MKNNEIILLKQDDAGEKDLGFWLRFGREQKYKNKTREGSGPIPRQIAFLLAYITIRKFD